MSPTFSLSLSLGVHGSRRRRRALVEVEGVEHGGSQFLRRVHDGTVLIPRVNSDFQGVRSTERAMRAVCYRGTVKGMALTGLAHNAVKRSHTPVYDSAVPPMKTLGDRRGDDLGLRGGEGSWWAEMERPAHQAVVFLF